MSEHKVVNHRHALNCKCEDFALRIRIIVTCSCGWRQGCVTRAQSKIIKSNHEAHPALPVVATTQLMGVVLGSQTEKSFEVKDTVELVCDAQQFLEFEDLDDDAQREVRAFEESFA